MILACLIISTMSFLMSTAALVWLLAKHLSTHNIQMVPVDPFKNEFGPMGKDPLKDFREIGDPIDPDDLKDFMKNK